MRATVLPLAAILAFATSAQAAFDTNATAAWVYDVQTNTVLMEKNADIPIPPASMSKLMTLYMVFEALDQGMLKSDMRLPVSTKARKMGGSTMFLNETDRPTVEQLIKGIIVLSGNNACVVVVEGLAGSEEAFARQMTKRAKEIGHTESTFMNSTGMPADGHRMSAEDLGILAREIITKFPKYYSDFSLTEYRFNDRAPANRFNRNPLLALNIGADGMKTGHTQESGYSLVGSAKQDERRVIFVISGLESESARAVESERIANWAFHNFTTKTVVTAGEPMADAPVWLGAEPTVGLVAKEEVEVLVPITAKDQIKAEIIYESPIPAPIGKGDEIGKIVVSVPNRDDVVTPLIAESDVPETGCVGRMQAAVIHLSQRAFNSALAAVR